MKDINPIPIFKIVVIIISIFIIICISLTLYINKKVTIPLTDEFYSKYSYIDFNKYFTTNTSINNQELRTIFLNDFTINKMCNIEYINVVCPLNDRDDYLIKGMLEMLYSSNLVRNITPKNAEQISMYILEDNMYKMLEHLYVDIPISDNITTNTNGELLKYMYYDKNNKSFLFTLPKEEFSSKKLVYLKNLTKDGDKYIADITEYYLSYELENFNENIKKIEQYIINDDQANLKLFDNNENIKLINKKITFSENSNGEYFKYKIYEITNDSLQNESDI